MDTQIGGGRKSICRYFASQGDCYYGDECQFLHFPNQRSNPASATLLPDSFPKLGSKLSASTFQPGVNNANALPPESKLSSYLHNNTSVGSEAFTFAATNGSLHDIQTGISQMNLNVGIPKRKMAANVGPTNVPITNGIAASFQPTSTPFIPQEDIKVELLKKQGLILNLSNSEAFNEIPVSVGNYHELYPLDGAITTPSKTFGMISTIYKATNMKTGELVCLRRLHSFSKLPVDGFPKLLSNQLELWQQIDNANVVKLHDVFFTKEFNDCSLIFVYDYFPLSKTLSSQYLLSSVHGLFNSGAGSPTTTNRPFSHQQQALRQKLLPESLIWSYIIQISSAIRTIHMAGLACGSLDPSKIIITSGFPPEILPFQSFQMHHPRVKLSSCGILDVINHEVFSIDLSGDLKAYMQKLQQEDLVSFGKLCVMLACNSIGAVNPENWSQSLDIISRYFSSDLRQLIVFLVSSKSNSSENSLSGTILKSINEIMPMIGARFYHQLDHVYQKSDQIEMELNKELDNGRLFRLLAKLGTINERPEYKNDPNWSETGDRYLIKLFRDYLFHQNGEDGRPFLDLGHIIHTLNKLEVGSPEKILLMSRDQQNVLIVSFAELRKCVDSAFAELLSPA